MATRAVFSAMTTPGARNAPVVTGHRRGGRRATTQKVRIHECTTTRCLKLESSFANSSMRSVRRVTRADARVMWRGGNVVKGGTAAFGAVWAVTRRGEAGDL